MSDTRAIDLLDRYKSLCARRDPWFPLWQSCLEMSDPVKASLTADLSPGRETPPNIYDSTPMQAKRALASTIGQLHPSTSRWILMRADDEDVDEADPARLWFDDTAERMWNAIYAPPAGFIQQTNAVDGLLASVGIGYLWIDENRRRNNLMFRALPIGSVAIDENSDGVIDTACIERTFTARQAYQRFGDQAGKAVLEAYNAADAKQKDKPFKYVQCIYPRYERDQRRSDSLNLPIASVIVSVTDQAIVEESGYHEMPLAVPRWEVAPGDIYPRSPSMLALPDARTLQEMGRTILIGGQKAVDPSIWYADDGVLSAVRTYPGGATAVSAETLRDLRGPPIGVLDTGKNIPLGREMQDDYRQMVGNAFFKNIFSLPEDPNETATMTLERKAQFQRIIVPTLSQIEPDYSGVIARRVFGLMYRSGQFKPLPDELKGQNVHFEFKSIVQQALREVEMAGLTQSIVTVAPLAQAKPQMLDNIDEDAIARDLPEAYGWRAKWIRPKDDVAAERQARQQAMAAQAGLAAVQQGASAGKDLAAANQSLVRADGKDIAGMDRGIAQAPQQQPVAA